MKMFTTFLIAFAISFLGSIPVGVLNLTIVDIALRKSFKQVLMFATASALIEYGQGFIALKFSSLFETNQNLAFYIDLIATPVFFILGIFYLRKHGKPPKKEETISDFKKGLLLSIVNPLAIPFWVVWGTVGLGKGWLTMSNSSIAIFTLGISMGTFATLLLYGLAAKPIIEKIEIVNQRINQIIGWVLIILGLLQLFKLFDN
jgi:threonine/homoserine/homoserine lactone efflux protein